LSSLITWIKLAAALWAAALVIALVSEVRPFKRWMPDWLRNAGRTIVLVGTVAFLSIAVLVGVQMMRNAWEARAQLAEGPALELSLESPGALYQSLYLSLHQAELNQTVSDDDTPVTFVVELGETATDVANRLEEEGLVVSGEVFRRFMAYHGLDVSLEAGIYQLAPNMTMHEIAEVFQQGGSTARMVTIPEGWRLEQIAWWLQYQGLMRADDFEAYARSAQFDYAWLASRPPGASLEGFLFPDTYEVAADATPATVVHMMLANFEARAVDEIQSRLPGRQIYDLAISNYRPLTVFDVIILASIVEREAVVDEERPIIASVYLNRLDPAHVEETALRLSSDPTIQYAKGYDPETESWWNPMLPGEGQQINSPYNTFVLQGLPPGPICSPGLASIMAVLEPASTDFLYFHAVGDGSHVFAATLEEHLRNQAQHTPLP